MEVTRDNQIRDDALEILSDIFYKIVKINLTDKTHKKIVVYKSQFDDSVKESDRISDVFKRFVDEGNVSEDDKESFLAFCDLGNLRRQFIRGKEYISLKYKRKIGESFRTVKMEFRKSSEYRDDNQVVLMYIKDIEDEITNKAKAVPKKKDLTEDVRRLNITKGTCDEGDMCLYIKEIAAGIRSEEEKNKFLKNFDREKLLEQFKNGTKTVSMVYFSDDEKPDSLYQITAEMAENSETGDIEAVVYVTDVSESYNGESMPKLMYEKEYQSIGFIDVNKKTILIRWFDIGDGRSIKGQMFDYEYIRNLSAGRRLIEIEKEEFRKKTQLDLIVRRIEENGSYEFSTYFIDIDGGKRLKKYRYTYFDKNKNLILSTIEDITDISEKDMLTGGVNRQGFMRFAGRMFTQNTDNEYAILFFNIRDFKAVNELFGTRCGDDILRYMYNLIKSSKLNPYIIARMDGDHFLSLIEKSSLDFGEIENICRTSYLHNNKQIGIYGRCGIYIVDDRNMKISSMCDRARLAAEFIDNDFVKPYQVFDNAMRKHYVDKKELVAQFDEAISSNQFKVYFQPIVDCKTGKVASAEALIRWEHPDKGMISPGIFVPALEENGYISRVDLLVEEQVRGMLERRFKNNQHIVPVSINLSWMDFFDVTMVNTILGNMDNSILDGSYSRYEITETSYRAFAENNREVLAEIKNKGAKILIDDFGSGYSSFSTLREYDFDIIKLDLGFVQKIGTSKKADIIIKSIIDMAHLMDAKVIAEGAEVKSQVDFLTESGCDYIQGFYFSKPLPADEFENVLDNGLPA